MPNYVQTSARLERFEILKDLEQFKEIKCHRCVLSTSNNSSNIELYLRNKSVTGLTRALETIKACQNNSKLVKAIQSLSKQFKQLRQY